MQAILQHTEKLAEQIYRFEFRTERHLDYLAGQFAEFTLPHNNPDQRGTRRWFTLSSSPTEQLIAITVKYRNHPSSFKQALRNMRLGDCLAVSDPLGDFVLPLDTTLPLAWIAGGIGITPYRSMATWLTSHNEHRDISLLHVVSQPNEAIYNEAFTKAGIVERSIVDTSLSQRPPAHQLLSQLADASERLIYIAGPEVMVATLERDLLDTGIGRERIITDQFLGYV